MKALSIDVNLDEKVCMNFQSPIGETALIERAKTEPDALAELYRLHQPRITAYVFRRVGHSQETEDVVANVFMAMVRGLAKYRTGHAPFVTWLYRIATNEINRCIRKRRIRSFFGLYTDVAITSQGTEAAEQLQVTLSRLPIAYQEVLSLHYLEELSVNEIATILSVSAGTVKSRLSRGRDLLRSKLQQD